MIEHALRLKAVSFDIAWLYCACLYDNGYSDWRMPNSVEAEGKGWYDSDVTWCDRYPNSIYTVLPVRNVDDT